MFLTAASICSMLPMTTGLHWSPLACRSAVWRNVAQSLSRSSHRDGVNVNRRSVSTPVVAAVAGLAATLAAVTASNVSVTEHYVHTRACKGVKSTPSWDHEPSVNLNLNPELGKPIIHHADFQRNFPVEVVNINGDKPWKWDVTRKFRTFKSSRHFEAVATKFTTGPQQIRLCRYNEI